MTAVSVLLPIHAPTPLLERAVACILAQTHTDLELLIIANGVDDDAFAAWRRFTLADARVRLERLERPGLAAALNHGLRVAKAAYVARMDADDWCPPHRLHAQLAAMEAAPGLVAIGTAFEIVDAAGDVISHEHPPVDPREAAWRLHLANPFAHGSMLMRRDQVLKAGGYDESLDRAQDYDLWLRLAGRVAACPATLYRYTAHEGAGYSSSSSQAAIAASCMTRAWASLPRDSNPAIASLLAGALGTASQAREAQASLGAWMTEHGASCEALMAWLACDRATRTGRDRHDAIRAAGESLLSQGVREIHLWGAGAHTAFALPRLRAMGLTIRGVIDDALRGTRRFDLDIGGPGDVPAGSHVLISSDRHEETMWNASSPLTARGVHVHRVYGG